MTTDYKNRATRTPKANAKPQSPGIVWFLAGAIFGVSLIGLAWLKFAPTVLLNDLGNTTAQQVAPLPTDLAQEVPTEPTAPTTPKPQPSTPQQLEFEFPNMLRNARVELPEQNSDTPVQPTQPPPAKPPVAVGNTQPGLVAPQTTPQTASQDVPETSSPPDVTNPESSEESSRQAARRKAAARRRIAREKAAARREAAAKRKAARQAAAAKRTTTPRGRSTSTGKQLGAFTNAENAQALRARLALRGIETQVRTVKRNNRTLHIVVQ